MVQIRFTDWRPGLVSIRLMHVFRNYTGMSLSEAKKAVESIILRETVTISLCDLKCAEELLYRAQEFGAIGEIVQDQSDKQ